MLVWRAETTTVVRGDAGLPAFLGMWVLSRAADGFPDLHADDLHAAHAGGSIFVFGSPNSTSNDAGGNHVCGVSHAGEAGAALCSLPRGAARGVQG